MVTGTRPSVSAVQSQCQGSRRSVGPIGQSDSKVPNESDAWFSQYNLSIVMARAFINSQSSKAHLILFQRIFGIAEADTGGQVQS
ncbi:hypothetical protein M422DRAFT_253749 [Sphaerobolus stellatus SS14]|uniref:Uncharacterized protein n=1 Tax=Sphaerobolus stellatus (strain SS14) TaxID=990650 RepID=A0A0C9VMC9_SPHS4|nr:hypothetical protein M422DRAFT_253749 [Sphaerobolus stellatus SS14]